MPNLAPQLELSRCPHCFVAQPFIQIRFQQDFQTTTHDGKRRRFWYVYACASCGGAILAGNESGYGNPATEIYPTPMRLDESIPYPARSYLTQAIETMHAPSGSVMLAASAVDAMLRAMNYKEGSLYSRINQAATDHLITPEMASWAHEVRLDANDFCVNVRHALL